MGGMWTAHHDDVPRSAQPAAFNPSGPSLPVLPDVAATRQQLRASMTITLGNLDFPFSEAELLQVLSELPSGRFPGPDSLPCEALRVGDACFRSCLLLFIELVRSWSIVPTVWRSAVVAPLHKSGRCRSIHKLPANQPVVQQPKGL